MATATRDLERPFRTMTAPAPVHPPSTVVLDMDGTLLDLHFDDQVWNHRLPQILAARRGCALEAAQEYVASTIAQARGTLDWYCLDYWGALFDVSIHAIERELAALIRPRPGTLEFLQHLEAQGIRSVLATNAHPRSLAHKLERTGIARWFSAIRSAHPYGHPKEHDAFWTALAADLDLEPATSLFVDDNVAVLDAARRFGIAELYGIHRPSSRGAWREYAGYPAVDSLAELIPRCARRG